MNKDNKFSRYNCKEVNHSVYCYPNTEVYKNKFNCKDQKILAAIEADITGQAIAEMYLEPIKGKFGIAHIKRIHKYIFSDIYPFAGKLRVEDISKGNSDFCRCQFIEVNLESTFEKLSKEHFLKGMKKDEIARRLAFYMAELNMIHPFREGNGRVFREYIRLLALRNGYDLEWKNVDGKELLKAMISSFDMERELLEKIISKSLI